VPNQSSSFRKFAGIQTVREIDGSPSIDASILEVSNGTLTEPSPGVARITTGGGGDGIRVREVDGTPDVDPCTEIIFPNGSIISVAGSVATIRQADYVGTFETGTIGTGDIGAGLWGFWYDTGNDQQWLVRNRAGTLFFTELTC